MASDAETLIVRILHGAETSFDARDIEPDLLQLRELFATNPDRRGEFVEELLGLLEAAPGELPLARPGAIEILEFTMHRLRWPEVRRALQELQSNTGDWRVRETTGRVLEAYQDDWQTADIYTSYQS